MQPETRHATRKEEGRRPHHSMAETEKEKLSTFHSRLKDCQNLAQEIQNSGEADMGRMTCQAIDMALWLTDQRIGMERLAL